MSEKLTTTSIMLILFLLSISLAWGWGYLIGAGLTYMGIIQNPVIVAWSFAALSGISLFLKLLSSGKTR